MLGISISYEPEHGAYISTDCIDETAEILLQQIFDKKRVVFHNAKFDLAFFEYHFRFTFPRFEDTMLLHYMLDENPGTHGLKHYPLSIHLMEIMKKECTSGWMTTAVEMAYLKVASLGILFRLIL